MSSKPLTLQVAAHFPAGTKVGVYPRVHDFFTPGQTAAVTTATVADDGTIALKGLVEHGPYFLAAEVEQERPTAAGNRLVKQWRSVAIIASDPSPAHDRLSTNEQADRERKAAAKVIGSTTIDTASAPAPGPTPVTGPRNTENSKPSPAKPARKASSAKKAPAKRASSSRPAKKAAAKKSARKSGRKG